MDKSLRKKGLVFGIIMMFIGASVLPTIHGNVYNDDDDNGCFDGIYWCNDEMKKVTSNKPVFCDKSIISLSQWQLHDN